MSSPEQPAGPKKALERVVVATDFERSARRAVRRAALLPLARGGHVTLLHALDPDLPKRVRTVVEKGARSELDEELKAARLLAKKAGRPDLRFDTRLVPGKAFVTIIQQARELSADLVLIGMGEPHGGLRERLLGSTTARVIRKSELPVLAVLGRALRPYRRAIFATDLASASPELFDLLVALLDPNHAEVDVLHAFQIAFEGAMSAYLPYEQVAEYRRETRRAALDGMRKLVESLEAPPGLEITSTLRNGEPRRLIVDEVSRRGIEVVAMGTHGRPGLSHALLGSVTEGVLHSAPCDLLVSHPAKFVFELP